MKKSSIWKLLFSALTVFAVAVFAGCTDDNDDMGAPYLNVTPENLTFDAEGQPADEYNGTFIVETNRPWRAIVEDEQTWVRLSATEGEGDAAVTVTVPASNIGQSAKVTFEVYNSYGALIQKDVNVLQGEVVPPTIIFNETAGNEAVDDKPLVSAYTGWNTTGEGASKVSYEGTNTSIRSSGKSSAGAYDGASGPNVIFFGTAPATFTVKNITLASGQTNLKLTFGGQYYDQDNNDNGFKKDDFVVSLSANGTDYTPLSYEVNNGDQEDPYWVFATKNFTLKNATSTLYIKFEANISSKFRLDDITLMTGNGGEEIDLAGGGVVPPDPSGDAIYENNFDKTPAEKVDNKWPFLDQTDAWQNASGTGNSTVSYAYTNMSVRTSGKPSGGYDGASGSNKIYFGSAPATFDIKGITLPAGKTKYRITFGGSYSKSSGTYPDLVYDNIFKPESFHVAVGNGTDWSGNLTYEKIGGSDTTDPYWIQFAVDFTLKEAVSQLSIRFTADLASAFAIDDVQLVEGSGGQEVDLEGGVVPPDPGEATAITIPELIAQMTDTEAPVDANADRYLDAVVMNDVAGANYTFNNLILATENATEAGNGITLYGSQVEPSTLGLNKGDKVRVTLYKGLAKVVNYSGMYEVTGAKEATWCKVEKTGTVTSIPTATIAAADLAKYQGMAVTIADASVAQAGVWANASETSSHTFTAGGANFTVFCKKSDEKNPSVFLDVPYKVATGNISGLAAVFRDNSQLVPRNLDDVAAFSDSSTPMITGVTPASLSFEAIGGEQTLTVSVLNQGDNQLSVSGLTPPLSATVSGLTVTVKADPNTGTQPVNQTLTITLANGNSKTVPVVLAGQGGGEGGDATTITVDFGESAQGLPTSKADGAGPSEKTYTFSGYEFIINVAAGANAYWLDGSEWNKDAPNKALYFNGDDTYIQFPVVAGKKLTKVEFSSPYGAGAGVGIVIKDTSDAIVAGGEMQTINANETITFNLTGTTADTAYRMARTAKNAQCTKLVLSYE
ncbi:DUF5689 domain-containing protein [Alistipes putredinis]|uniref:DUF5689 domain-containing protein n=1 Tax=Alistipes putredinis TaxID=28117 RepID=UPI003AB2B3AB